MTKNVSVLISFPFPWKLNCLLTLDISGEMTLEEFIEGAKDHDDIMDMLKKMMDLTPVLVIIVEGRTGWVCAALGQQRLISQF